MPNNFMKSDAADDKLIEVGDLRINSRDRSTQLRGEHLKLTATEFNLLYVLVQNAGNTVSKSKLSILHINLLFSKEKEYLLPIK